MTTEYEALDLADMQNEYNRVSAPLGTNQNDDYMAQFVQLPQKDGFVSLRILPRKKGQKLFTATRVHTLSNPAQKDEYGKPKKRSYHCPKVLVQTDKGPRWQGECIICKYYSDLWQQSLGMSGKAQEDLQQKARDIKPVERYYYNVIVRSEKGKDGVVNKNVGPKIYSCGKTVHAKVMRAIVGDDSAGEKALGDVSHPITGRDFRVVKKVVKGAGGSEYPSYDNSKFDDPTPVGNPDELSAWLENSHDLQSLRVVKDAEELRQALRVHLGMVAGPTDVEDHDLDEFRTQKSTSTSAASVSVEEPIREELMSSSTPTQKAPEDEELLADDDFMNELNAI